MIKLIQQRLDRYQASDVLAEQQALKEIIQELALYALWRADFFTVAAFQGGTSLRILHDLPRFSEDLDFILLQPNATFDWSPYLQGMLSCFAEFGLQVEVFDKSRMDQNIKKALLKPASIGQQLNVVFAKSAAAHQSIKIKLEIDVNPPEYSQFAYTYLDFPLDYEVCHQDLSSNFALKIHALLCRPYLKGRDWYDFNWYIKNKIPPNFAHLQAALYQYGPWKTQSISVDADWLRSALLNKNSLIDWRAAASDVARFIGHAEQKSLSLWSEAFFSQKIQILCG